MQAGGLSAADAQKLREFERQGHDRVAQTYDAFFSPVTALAIEPVLDAVMASPGMRLLDIACGPGALTAAAANRGAHAVGIDLSPRMLELARQHHPDVDFREADVEHLPFADDSFDAVTGNFALGHLPYPEVALTECVRVLRGGGRIAIAWWDHPDRQRIQGVFREAIAELGAQPAPDVPQGHATLRFCETKAFLALLHGAGLADVAIEAHGATYTIPDAETFWHGGRASLVLTGAAIRAQDTAMQAAIRTAFERRIEPYRDDSGFTMPVAFNIGRGRKPSQKLANRGSDS
jgi:ubiquinone/menaquinone biosynthesis C-methylase UbiE